MKIVLNDEKDVTEALQAIADRLDKSSHNCGGSSSDAGYARLQSCVDELCPWGRKLFASLSET